MSEKIDMTKDELVTLAHDLSQDELTDLISELQVLRANKNTQFDNTVDADELTDDVTYNPKDGAWIIANSPLVGAWSDMTGDTLEWSNEIRRKIESRTDGEKKSQW
jgi:hypothetical protein